MPMSVPVQNDGMLGLQYQDLIPVLISAVNDLNAKVTALQNDMNTVKAKLQITIL
jgi:hypothetical protein